MESNKDLLDIEKGILDFFGVLQAASGGLEKNLSEVFTATILAIMTEFTELQRDSEGCTENLLAKEWASLFSKFAEYNTIGIVTEVVNV